MSGEVWRRAEIESPCRKLCVLDRPSGLCLGCFRTGEEIGAWTRLSAEARRAVMAELPAREAAFAKRPRRGGRAARIGDGAGGPPRADVLD